MTRRVVVGVGSNLGDREAALRAARDLLRADPGLGLSAVSPVWETAPVGPPQPAYLNAAFLLVTALPLDAVLARCMAVERSLGRERRERWGPRTVDLDILWAEGERVDGPGLTVPHAALRDRVFALDPLLALAPAARDPLDGESYGEVRARLPTATSRPFALGEG